MPYAKFFIVTGLQFIATLGLFYWIAPTTFKHELSQPWMLLFWTFILGIPLSLFEYIYHRYMLHSAVLPFIGSMHRAHTHHHGLTNVKAPVLAKEPEKLVPVKSDYPIVEEHQEESMMFPLYAISIFNAIFLILLAVPFKLLFPGQPVILGTLCTVLLAYTGYEVWHAILHLPYDRFWKPLMDGPRTRKISRYIYSFHLMHHWRPSINLAVVGFWGWAVWDHLFRTHRRPNNIPLQGSQVSYNDVWMKKPVWPISMLDKWQGPIYKWSRRVEQKCARIFLRRKTQ